MDQTSFGTERPLELAGNMGHTVHAHFDEETNLGMCNGVPSY